MPAAVPFVVRVSISSTVGGSVGSSTSTSKSRATWVADGFVMPTKLYVVTVAGVSRTSSEVEAMRETSVSVSNCSSVVWNHVEVVAVEATVKLHGLDQKE